MRTGLLVLMISLLTVHADAAVQTRTVEYQDGDTLLEGFLAYDDAFLGARKENVVKRPGVLVVHESKGVGKHAKNSARRLAELGYVALAVDMYGKGIRPKDNEEASHQLRIYKNDRPLTRQRIEAGLKALESNEMVDTNQIAAIGYCFGGMVVLELARGGADVKGVVTFHGALNTPTPEDAKNIKGRILVLHGADDPYVKSEEVNGLEEEMKKAGVNYQVIQYPGVVHSFTNPAAGDDPAKGAAYNAEADKKSWEEMKKFLAEILKSS